MPGKIEGTVVSITPQGNLVTDIDRERLGDVPRGDGVSVRCDGHETNGIFEADHQEPDSTLLAVIGSGGTLELEIVGDSARIMLGVDVGTKVQVVW